MQKAVVYINRPANKENVKEQAIIMLAPLYETAKLHNLKIVNHFFENINSFNAFLALVDYLKKNETIKNVIMDNNEIIMNEKIFPELLELKRTIFIVGEKYTKVIKPAEKI